MSVEASSWAWRQPVKGNQKLVLLALADHADREGVCWPGQRGLADKCGITDRAVRDQLVALEAGGYIAREARWRDGGGRSTDCVTLRIKAEDSSGRPGTKPEDFAGANRKPLSALNRKPASGDRTVSEEPPVEPSDISGDALLEVFDHWRNAFGLNGSTKFTPGRREKVRARLRTYPLERVKLAIDGCAASEWHRDNGHIDLTLICRSDEKLEEFERRAAAAKPKADFSAYDRTLN